MARTYIAGVFLTICTYEGHQLVYHYYDDGIGHDDKESEKSSDEGLEWSEEESSDGELTENVELFYPKSPSSKSISSPITSGITPASRSSFQPSKVSLVGPSSSGSSHPGDESTGSVKTPSLTQPRESVSGSSTSTMDQARAVSASSIPGSTPHTRSTPRSGGVYSKFSDFTNAERSSEVVSSPSLHAHNDSPKARPDDLPCNLDRDILAEILTPPEAMCNEKFTLTVDNCIFVGIPVHILESGTWRPLREGFSSKAEEAQETKSNLHGSEEQLTAEGDGALEAEGTGAAKTLDPESSIENENPSLNVNDEPAMAPNGLKGVVTDKDSPMRMFHVSFALIPPITEAATCEERVYRYILVPLVRMLRQEQASKNYVWDEVAKMQRAQETVESDNVSELQEAMENASELARALRKMCNAIANMDIARILIGSKARAFQVPLQLELAQLPSWYDEVSPHSYVSTINSPLKEIGHECYECYGLLLLDDPEVIVQEIEVDPQGPVAAMIRNIEPTLSLEELALQNNIEIKQIVNLVWSLVYWRRARIIIPIHARYTYCSSPLSPRKGQFSELAQLYNNMFPMMPPLQKLLALLSAGKPKPFAIHIPSTDHRHIYLQTLAWLLQKDFVTHLPTFALIVVTRKIKVSSMNTEDAVENKAEDDIKSRHSGTQPDEELGAHGKHINVDLRLTPESGNGFSDVSGDAVKLKRLLKRRFSNRLEIEEIQDTIIQDPRKATPLEKRWLGQIAVSGSSRNSNLAALFQRLTKYFNGKDCLEQVMIHERISREDMRSFMQEFNQYIVTYKHW